MLTLWFLTFSGELERSGEKIVFYARDFDSHFLGSLEQQKKARKVPVDILATTIEWL